MYALVLALSIGQIEGPPSIVRLQVPPVIELAPPIIVIQKEVRQDATAVLSTPFRASVTYGSPSTRQQVFRTYAPVRVRSSGSC